ncbi:Thioesterase/thiol ester dehydrase-isomerase, partial [Atractiella rhizophila]
MTASTKFVRQVWASFLKTNGHDATCFPNLQIISAKPGYVKASLKVEPYNVNRLGTLHGGLIGSLVDTMGSLSVASKGLFMTGVSTDISTTYLKSSKPGDTIICETSLLNLGKTMAFT